MIQTIENNDDAIVTDPYHFGADLDPELQIRHADNKSGSFSG
jgi:hypothetical protein